MNAGIVKTRRSKRFWLVTALAILTGAVAVALGCAVLWARNDARLTALTQARLDDALDGRVQVGRVHYRWPSTLTLENIQVADRPGEAPLLQVHQAQTHVGLGRLLRGKLVFGPTTLDGVDVYVDTQALGADAPEDRSAPSRAPITRTLACDLHRALRRLPAATLAPITLTRGYVQVVTPQGTTVIEGLTSTLGAATHGNGELEAHLAVQAARATVTTGAMQVSYGPLALAAPEMRLRAAEDIAAGLTLDVAALQCTGDGFDLTGQAHAQLAPDDSFHASTHWQLGATLDHPALQALMPRETRRLVAATGGLQADFGAQLRGSLQASPPLDTGVMWLQAGGDRVGVAHLPFDGLWAEARLDGLTQGHVAIDLGIKGGTVAARADLTRAGLAVGAHDIAVLVQDLPLGDLMQRMRPWAEADPALRGPYRDAWAKRDYWPQAVTVRLHAAGDALWPQPRTRVEATTQLTGIRGRGVPASAMPITVLAQGEAQEAGLVLDQFEVVAGRKRLVVAARGRAGWRPQDAMAWRVTMRSHQLRAMLHEAGLPMAAQGLALDFNLMGSPRVPQGRGELRIRGLHTIHLHPSKAPTSTDLGDLIVPLDFTGGTLFTRGASLVGSVGKAGLTGFVRLLTTRSKPLKKHAMNYEVRLLDMDLASLAPQEAGHPTSPGPRRTVSARALVAGDLEAPEVALTLDAQAPEGQAHAWATIDRDHSQLHQLVLLPTTGGAVWGTGSVTHAPAHVHLALDGHVPNAQNTVTLAVQAQAQGPLDGEVQIQALAQSPKSRVTLGGTLDVARALMDLSVDTQATVAELAQWSDETNALRPTGHITGQIRVHGPWSTPTSSGELLASGLGLSGKTLGGGRLHALLRTPDRGHYQLTVRAPKALDADVDVLTHAGPIRIDVDVPRFALAALYPPLAAQGADVTGEATLNLKLGRRSLTPMGTLTVRRLVATSRGEQLALEAPTRVYVDGKNVGLGRTILVGTPGRLALEGNYGRVVRGRLAGRLALGFITPFVPALTYARGEMAMEAMAQGSREAPEVSGSIEVTRPAVFRPRGMPMELRIASGRVALTPSRLDVETVRGGIEGGAFAVDGHIALAHYQPESYHLGLEGHGLPVRYEDLLLESNIALSCQGTGVTPIIRGEVDVVSGRYLKQLELRDFTFVLNDKDTRTPVESRLPWLRQIGLDVHATSHDGVDIAVDAGAFAVKASLETDLHIGGNALNPRLSGKVSAREGSLSFPQGMLHLQQAAIDFEPSRRSVKDPMGAEVVLRAEGEVTPTSLAGAQAYVVSMNLEGPPDDLNLDLTSNEGLTRLEVLSLLSTGRTSLSDLAASNDDVSKLDAAEALAGSLVSAPVSRFAQKKIEQALNLKLDLSADVTRSNVRVMAAKNISRRFRLEGAFSHGIAQEQSNVSTRAQMALTDRLRIEGVAARDLTGSSVSATPDRNMQSNLELKYRVLGQ